MKPTGLFWWIDRWRKSSAYMDMTLEQQGAYRNLLDEAHLRGGPLPNDDRILAKACGDALAWERVKATVLGRFTLTDDGWRNETLDEVYAKTMALSAGRSESGKLGGIRSGEARRQAKHEANIEANTPSKTPSRTNSPSPSPSPSLVSVSGSVSVSKIPVTNNKLSSRADAVTTSDAAARKLRPVDGQSKRPIFRGQRITVFEWMLEDISQMLGPAYEDFGLDEFFDRLDKIAARQNVILPKPQVWPWIQQRVIAEAASRGLAVATAEEKPHKRDVRDAEALALMRSIQ